MNTRYPTTPEIIGSAKTINGNGDEQFLGDRVVGIYVGAGKEQPNGVVQINIRNFKGSSNLIVEIELPELIAALSMATLNSERS